MTLKKLYLLRHAKSDQNADVASDKERPINPRGKKDCITIGNYLKANSIRPDLVLCSDAVRTTQTANNIFKTAGFDVPIVFLKELYLATPGEILKEIAKIDNSISSIMVICHNPGIHQLAAALVGNGDRQSILNINDGFPTNALAMLSLNTEKWAVIDPKSAYLDNYITPKILEGR